MTGEELKQSRRLLFMLFVAWGVGFIDVQAVNIASVPMRSELGLSTIQVGMAVSGYFLMYSLMTMSSGWFVNHLGVRRALAFIMVAWGLFSGLTGTITSLVALLAMRSLLGFTQGGLGGVTSVAIMELFPPEKRGRAKAFQASAGSVGVAVGILFCAAMTQWFGWRVMFGCFAVVGALLAFLFMAQYKTPHLEKRTVTVHKQLGLKQAVTNSNAMLLAFIQFGLGAFMWGLNAWLPSYWVESKGLDLLHMGMLSLIPWIVSFVFMNFSSYILDVYFNGRERYALSAILVIGGLLLYAMLKVSSIAAGFALLTAVTVLMSIGSATVYMLSMKYMPSEMISSSTGLVLLGQQLGGVVAPPVMGALLVWFAGNYDAVFGFVILLVFLGALASLRFNSKKDSVALAQPVHSTPQR